MDTLSALAEPRNTVSKNPRVDNTVPSAPQTHLGSIGMELPLSHEGFLQLTVDRSVCAWAFLEIPPSKWSWLDYCPLWSFLLARRRPRPLFPSDCWVPSHTFSSPDSWQKVEGGKEEPCTERRRLYERSWLISSLRWAPRKGWLCFWILFGIFCSVFNVKCMNRSRDQIQSLSHSSPVLRRPSPTSHLVPSPLLLSYWLLFSWLNPAKVQSNTSL